MSMMKKLCTAFFMTLLLMAACAVCAFAAPDTLSADAGSSVDWLVAVKSPELAVSATNKQVLPISATAGEGVRVTVYKYNPDTGLYHKVWVNGAPLEAVVGPTRLFAGQVELYSANNKFIVRAESNDGNYQCVRFEVNLLDSGIMDRIRAPFMGGMLG